ncbi:MAG TPA: VCBS repeat-containing protein, partial [Parafilimonas sp.]
QYHLLVDSGFYYQQMRNMLQLNEGEDENKNVRFSEIAQLAGVSNTDWSWSALFSDFDNDGWKDLFISNGYLRDYTNMDFLKFTVADSKIAAAKQGNQNFQTYDLVQQMPSNKLSNYIFHNNHDLSFTNETTDWGLYKPTVSNAAAYADFDNDGAMDLVVCNNNEPVLIYRNNANELLHHHYIKIRLTGEGMNTKAYGVKIEITTPDSLTQYQELYPVRGYQSTVSQDILFGISSNTIIQQIKILWPNNKETILRNVNADQIIDVKETDAKNVDEPVKNSAKLFTDVTDKTGLNFTHKGNDFIDFKAEPLLPYQLSKQGPALAKADVNGDGLEDIFFGGGIGQSGVLYLQTKGGKFIPSTSQPWQTDSSCEDVNAVFFDANKDGFMDLYVVSGGNVYDDGSPEYEDRLYINDGKGNFIKSANTLPQMFSSKCAVAVGDFDNDGYEDLFVGGRGIPGSFPLASKSYLLHNDSKNGVIHFTDVTDSVCAALRLPGMVTAACFA